MGCKSKRKYFTEVEALVNGSYCLKKRPGTLRAYLCPDCNHWHLTSKKKQNPPEQPK